MIQAVLFDFDGLMLDTEYPEFLAWKEVFESHGCQLALEMWVVHIGRGAGNASFSPYEELETQLGRPIERDIVRAAKRKRFAKLMADQKLLPGVEARLREARERGCKVGLVSSSPREWITNHLARFGTTAMFDACFCGDEVQNTKPHPELYLKALFGFDVGADRAVVLEDSANGIAAAKAAGLFCVAVSNTVTRHSCLDQADLIVNSLADITLAEIEDRFFRQVCDQVSSEQT